MAGMVLKELDYSDLERFGRVTIDYDKRGVAITVDGFEFSEAGSCREHVGKALAWARDALDVEISAIRLVPGGHIRSCTDLDQEMLDELRKAVK
jgi:hypothetical protein